MERRSEMSFLKRRCTRRLLVELYLRCGYILPSFCVDISLVYLIACAGHAPWWQPRTQRNRSSKHVIAHFSRLVRCCVQVSTCSEQNVQRRRIRLPFQGKLASLASEFLDGQLSKKKVLRFLFILFHAPCRQVVLTGDSGVGKSNLLSRFTRNE